MVSAFVVKISMAMSGQVTTIQTAYLEQLLAADMVRWHAGTNAAETLKYQCRLYLFGGFAK